jgi:hypothetical protein
VNRIISYKTNCAVIGKRKPAENVSSHPPVVFSNLYIPSIYAENPNDFCYLKEFIECKK